MDFLKELWGFLKARKKFWLLPILILISILGLFVFLGANPAVSPFIYTLF